MQPNISTPQHIRNSYSFSLQEGFSVRTPQVKTFPSIPLSSFPSSSPLNHHDQLAASIKALEARTDLLESPSRKKLATFEGSPTVLTPNSQDNRFRPQFANNCEGRGQEVIQDQFLRVTCSNVLRKFDSSGNLSSNLRNTTHFNSTKFGNTSPNDFRKTQEDYNHFKMINHSKTIAPDISPNNSGFLRQEKPRNAEGGSRTPGKVAADKKLDESGKMNGSKTPIKYKNVFDGNKNSGISKVSTQAGGKEGEQKKTFKSLNQIVESKARQKMVLQISQASRKYSKIVNGFEVGQVLGKGKFGQVFLGRQQEAGFLVALKKVVKSKVMEYKMLDQFCSEIRLHSCLDHPNIVKFYGCFQEKDYVYLVLQYMNGGTLFDYLNEVNYLGVRQAVEYLRDIIEALIYMHEKSIAHRDIKPENIVISSEGVAKLCDFGWSAVVETSRKTYCGTFDYAPPEILERKNYGTSVDIWCIGVLTYELLTGRVPFEGEQRNVIMQKIVNVDKNKIDYPVEIPPEAKEFIQALVQKDPNLRPKCQDLLKFKLFSVYSKPGKPKKPS